mgnify:CR=1 FL=1
MEEKAGYKARWEIAKIKVNEKVRKEIENQLKNGGEIDEIISQYPEIEIKHEFMHGNILLVKKI